MSGDLASAVTFGEDQPERFLTAWFGPPAGGPEKKQVQGLPSQLIRWHEQVSRWGHDRVMQQNRVPSTREMSADVLLVGVETQAVWLWGIREDEIHPIVMERENEPAAEWASTGEPLEEFLWHFTLIEAVFGGRFGLGANNATRAAASRFTAEWSPVAAQPWRWPGPGQQLWVQGKALAWTFVNDRPDAAVTNESWYSIFVSAPTNEDLLDIHAADIDWDWDSRLALRQSDGQ